VVKPLGEYLVFLLGPLNYQQQLKSCKNNIWWFKLLILPSAAKGVDTFTNAIKDGSSSCKAPAPHKVN
jgi:hypothetical protein